jgi:ankyrin repeat protein
MVEFLLERGADPNLIKKGYRFPLYDATNRGNLRLLNLLLDHGADISISDARAFGQATWGGEKILSRLLEQDMTTTEREMYLDRALQNAAYYANLNICKWLLDHGANLNFVGGEYGGPLQAALSNGQISLYGDQANNSLLILNMFLARGANVNNVGQSSEYRSALVMAVEKRAAKIAQIVLNAGADPNIGGGDLYSPLQAAARYNQSMLKPLLAAGADVSTMGGRFGTALHAAAYAHDCESIELLLRHGADVNIIAGKYGSVIQAAAKRDSVSTGGWTAGRESVRAIQLLHDHGASITVEAGKYCTALQMAAKSGNLAAVKWLLTHGADPRVKGGRFGTALKGALKKERWAVVSYLEQHFGREKGE